MKIVIIGDGKVGHKLAYELAEEDHDIVLVDQNTEKLKNTLNELDVNCIEGDGASKDVLEMAGISNADIAIACVSSDQMNMLCCLMARKLGAKKTVARVRNPVYYQQMYLIKDDLGLSMSVNPELAAAKEISRVLIFPTASRIDTLARGRAEIVEYKIDPQSKLAGLSLEQLGSQYPGQFLICAVQRGGQVTIPDGQFVLQAGDRIHIVASHHEVEKFFKVTGKLKHRIETVIIGGGGRIAYYLASKLQKVGMKIKLIEKDRERCLELCDLLPSVTIIHGDATDNELLLESGIDKVDAFVALTGLDEENAIMSMYARNRGVSKIISKINSSYLTSMMYELGFETVVSPKSITADIIVGYVRAMQNSLGSANVEAVYQLVDEQVEALEFMVREKTSYTGIPLKELKLKKNLLLASIVRDRKIIVPNGDTTIEKDDFVIVIAIRQNFQDLREILA